MDDPRQYPPPPNVIHESISARRFLFRLVFTLVTVMFWGGIVLPIVWEILGKGHAGEHGNIDALGLPDWAGFVFFASGCAWWGMALWAAERSERAESSAGTAASAHTPTDAPSTSEPP
jgi:hypothetical protein